jgi:hypothetical protein
VPLLEGKRPDQARGPGGQPPVLPGHADPPCQLPVPVQGEGADQGAGSSSRPWGRVRAQVHPSPRAALRPLRASQSAPPPANRGGDVEGIAGERRIRTITQDGALIAGQQGAQHQRVLPARLAQHRGHQAAGKQALQGNPEVVIGTEAVIRPRGPQGEQAALWPGSAGSRRQRSGSAGPAVSPSAGRRPPQPGGKQVAGTENAIWRADRPGCHLPRLPLPSSSHQRFPGAARPATPLARRGARAHLDQQIHSFPTSAPGSAPVPGRHHTPV